VHHSPNQLTFATAYRLGWTGKLTGILLFFVPLVWLGFPPAAVAMTLAANLLYQFWLHVDWIPKLGWLEYVLNTPSHHRVHHAANPEYLDANYGGVLIVFDRLFGTFVAERADLPCRYGLVHPVTTYNPLRIAFAEWIAMARDLGRARSVQEALGCVFGPPGWRPDGTGATTENLRRAAAPAAIRG
jgi:sterol desaturase/sphingolipid hydroxylase (fatty acid hydroxylase superfamily)